MSSKVIIMDEYTYKNERFSHHRIKNKRKFTGIHYHDEYELYYLINGETKYFIGDEIFSVKKDNFVFVPKGMFHKTDSETCLHNERILVCFDDTLFNDENRYIVKELCKTKVMSVPESKLNAMSAILHNLENESEKKDEYSDFLFNLYTLELLTLLCRYRRKPKTEIEGAEKLIHDISEYISQNYDKPITLSLLGNIFSVSESHLCRKFKDISGIGINEYITYVRILNAEKLLKSGKYSITDTALRCGFNDSNYFSTVFKKAKGITPLKFAKSAKK